jgi:hypothetical protein
MEIVQNVKKCGPIEFDQFLKKTLPLLAMGVEVLIPSLTNPMQVRSGFLGLQTEDWKPVHGSSSDGPGHLRSCSGVIDSIPRLKSLLTSALTVHTLDPQRRRNGETKRCIAIPDSFDTADRNCSYGS